MTTPLQAHALTRAFGDETALDGVDLTVEAGEIHAIVGLNGAGKTTLMRLLMGMLRPDSGTATVLGHEASDTPSVVWRRVGHLIETPSAYREMTVTENLLASALLHGIGREEAADPTQAIINDFDLGKWANRRAGALSLGNKQRLGLASALVHRPAVLVLDEPANSLDPAGVVFIRGLLQRLSADGAAVLVSSHHLDQLARIADRITVLHRGRVVGDLAPEASDLEQRFFDMIHADEVARRKAS